MVSAVAALMAAMMVVMSGPAMASHLDFNDDDNDFVIFGDLNDDEDNCDFNDVFGRFGNDDCDLNDLNDFGFLGNNGFNDGLDQESRSGDVENNFRVSNTGDYASQCTPALQFGNTGNFNNGSSFVQFGSGVNNDDHNHFIGRHPFGFFGDDDNLNDFVFFGDDDFGTSRLDDFEPGGIEFTV